MPARLAQRHGCDRAVVAQADGELGLGIAGEARGDDVVRAGPDRGGHPRLVAGVRSGAADAGAGTAGAARGRAPGRAGLAARRRLLQALEVLGAPAFRFLALAAGLLGRLALALLGKLLLALFFLLALALLGELLLPLLLGLALALQGEALAFLLGLALLLLGASLFLGRLALALLLGAARLLGPALLLRLPFRLLDRDLRIGLRRRGLGLRFGPRLGLRFRWRLGRRFGLRLGDGPRLLQRGRRRPELRHHRRRFARLPGHADHQHGEQAQVDHDRQAERLQAPGARGARAVREAVGEGRLAAHRPSGSPSSPTRSTLARLRPSSTNITAS